MTVTWADIFIFSYFAFAIGYGVWWLSRPHVRNLTAFSRLAGGFLTGIFWLVFLTLDLRNQIKSIRLKNERANLLAQHSALYEQYASAEAALTEKLEGSPENSSIEQWVSSVLSIQSQIAKTRKSLNDNAWFLRRYGVTVSDRDSVGDDLAVFHFSKSWFGESNTPEIRFASALDAFFGLTSHLEQDNAKRDRISVARFQRVKPERYEDWTTYFSPSFKKDVAALDRKFAGRVMEAILEIVTDPTSPHGDTQKPLGGPLKGQWRYRLGDYRVIYLPREESFVIVFLRCSSRGDVYH